MWVKINIFKIKLMNSFSKSDSYEKVFDLNDNKNEEESDVTIDNQLKNV